MCVCVWGMPGGGRGHFLGRGSQGGGPGQGGPASGSLGNVFIYVSRRFLDVLMGGGPSAVSALRWPPLFGFMFGMPS